MRTTLFLCMLLILGLAFLPGAQAAPGNPGIRFEITGTGSITHLESVVAGQKPFVGKVTAAQIALCIAGTGNGCNNVETDPGGKAYLYVPNGNGEIVYVSTDPTCLHLTQLNGIVGGTGTFMYAGDHDFNNNTSHILIQGTVTFDKTQFPSLVPLSIKKGSILSVSEDLNHYGVGTFTTVGAGVQVNCLP